MEETHKKILQRNRTNLVSDLDPSKLYDGLLEKGVFTPDMIDEIKVRAVCVVAGFSFTLCCLWGNSTFQNAIVVTQLVIVSEL